MSEQKERLKKLHALAMRGVGGEKEQAQKILEKLMQKYGISLNDLDEEQIREFDIVYHGEIARKLLLQTAYKVTGSAENVTTLVYRQSGRQCRTKMRVRCTEAQKIEIEFLLDFYCKLWEKESAALFRAFIQKHEIFADRADGKCDRISDEEYLKMQQLMRGLSDETPLLQIEGAQT